MEQLAALPDPVGQPLARRELDAGLELTQVKSPLGVLLIIFESRPDAVIQIGALALRAGDAVLLKGGSEATRSNRALVGCLRDALAGEGLDPEAVQGVEGRAAVAALLELDELIDLVIPRGSGELVRQIQQASRIRFAPQALTEGTRLLEAFGPYHLGKKPRSLTFLEQIRK